MATHSWFTLKQFCWETECTYSVSPQKFRVMLAIFPVSLRPSSCASVVDPKLACWDSTVFEYWIPYLPLWTLTLPNITKGSISLRYGTFYTKSYTVLKRGCVRVACSSRPHSSRYFVSSSLASCCRFPFESAERGPPTF